MKLSPVRSGDFTHSITMKAVQIRWKYAIPAGVVAVVIVYYFLSSASGMFFIRLFPRVLVVM